MKKPGTLHRLARKAGFEDWGKETGSDPPKQGLKGGQQDPEIPWGASAGREGHLCLEQDISPEGQ